jgi:hypothetical protein
MPKNQLHDMAKQVKVQIVEVLEQLKVKPSEKTKELFYKLLKKLFGPNSFSHFSSKKNQDIMMPLCSVLSEEQTSDYIENWLSSMYTKPDLQEFYYRSTEDSIVQKHTAIKQFALTQLASITQLFKELTAQQVMITLNVLTKAAFLKNSDSKIFTFIALL